MTVAFWLDYLYMFVTDALCVLRSSVLICQLFSVLLLIVSSCYMRLFVAIFIMFF